MKKAIFITAMTLAVSGCFTIGSTFERWVGTYEYDGTSYRVAYVRTEGLDGDTRWEYHLVPGGTTTYRSSDMIARCLALEVPGDNPTPVSGCEASFARAIDGLVGPPMMGGDDYG
ncbi:hypothetical protein [Gymnodinialimonas ceratoperidinii]|uniref:Lipoprotein n=1 Tax=Gymnodinialimonas ceratoperidinii TaxID=2856823 RepID=A0A8F6YD68_9RHOB|nr:hypothetical protein [Gymnodinialimonas ceratoperidinii]QXT40105.1 hypothetical protein KYE46_02270 [Gymnodinialimonas ceratoperidinii]